MLAPRRRTGKVRGHHPLVTCAVLSAEASALQCVRALHASAHVRAVAAVESQ